MDYREKRALAAVCGADIKLPASGRGPIFATHLVDFIARYELEAFFAREPSRAVNGIDVRPRVVDWHTEQVDTDAMAAWRRAYKAATTIRRIMVATIANGHCENGPAPQRGYTQCEQDRAGQENG